MVSLFRRGTVWWAQYRTQGRRVRVSLGTENRRVAEELRLRKEIELRQDARPEWAELLPGGGGVAVLAPPVVAPPAAVAAAVVAAPRATLAQVREEYETWSKANKRPKTVLNDTGRLDDFFATVPGKELHEVTAAELEKFLTKKALGGAKPATVLRNREILHAFFQFAARLDYLVANPVSKVARPRLPEREPRFLSLPQIDELLRAVGGDLIEPVVAVAVFAGLRREELCWLTWEDLALEPTAGILRVRSKTVGGESWGPKTKKNRAIPLGSRLRVALERHKEQGGKRGVPWLFPSPDGCRWDPDNLGRRFREVLDRAGLKWNFLELRHTFGSQLARKGVSLVKIARLMGNSPVIASRHYINLVPEEMAVDVEF